MAKQVGNSNSLVNYYFSMTLLELKQAATGILGVSVSNLTVNGLDLGLLGANAVRLQAEQFNDFEFQRKTLSLNLDVVSGSSLDGAVIYPGGGVATIKTLIDITQQDTNGNEVPMEWTTRAESLERIRSTKTNRRLRYPTDADLDVRSPSGMGRPRLELSGNNMFPMPRATQAGTISLLLEAYCYSSNWTSTSNTVAMTGSASVTANNTTYYRYGSYNGSPLFISLLDGGTPAALYFLWYNGTQWINNQLPGTLDANYHSLTTTASQNPAGSYTNHGTYQGVSSVTSADADSTTDVWLTLGFNYMLWALVVWLNNSDNTMGKKFVARTEGNLPPPQAQADAALQALITNDLNRFEQFRRHGRR